MRTVSVTRITTLVVLTLVAASVWSLSLLNHGGTSVHAAGGPPGRTRLEVCVQRVDGTAVAADDMNAIKAAFKEVKKHPDYEAAGLGAGGEPKIKLNCPRGPTIKENKAHKVTKPSPEFTFIFIASEEELAGIPFKHYPRVKSQETMCEGDTCAEVTKALYLTPQELADPAKLVPALAFGVGLMPTDPPQSQYVDGVTPDPANQQR